MAVDAVGRQGLRDGPHGVGLFGDEQGVDPGQGRRDPGRGFGRRSGIVALDGLDVNAVPGRRLLVLGQRDIAVVVVGDQGGQALLALAGRIIDDPVDIGLDQERQEIDAA